MQSHSPNKIKELIIIFYLIDVNVPFAGNMQAAYTEKKIRKHAELNIEVKQKWQVGAMYTYLPLYQYYKSFLTRCMMSSNDYT